MQTNFGYRLSTTKVSLKPLKINSMQSLYLLKTRGHLLVLRDNLTLLAHERQLLKPRVLHKSAADFWVLGATDVSSKNRFKDP